MALVPMWAVLGLLVAVAVIYALLSACECFGVRLRNMKGKAVVITGCDSGFGNALARVCPAVLALIRSRCARRKKRGGV